jgi:sec-independent protein translocase protein TatC
MNFFLEFQNRTFLITFIWFYLIIVCYYYKKILFFLLLNKLILKKKLEVYFVYTNVTELFFIYLKLINFFTLQVIFWFFCYHFLIFMTPALYKKEFFNCKKLICILIINWQVNFIFTIVFIFPVTWGFFENFQKLFITNLIHLEIKINEYFQFFTETYFLLQFYIMFITIIIYLFKNFYYNKIYTKRYRKFNYFLFLTIFSLVNPIDITNQLLFCNLFIYFYEFSLVFYFFNKNFKKQFSR